MAEVKYELDVKLVQDILNYMGKQEYAEVRHIMIPFDKIVMDTNAEFSKNQKDKK